MSLFAVFASAREGCCRRWIANKSLLFLLRKEWALHIKPTGPSVDVQSPPSWAQEAKDSPTVNFETRSIENVYGRQQF